MKTLRKALCLSILAYSTAPLFASSCPFSFGSSNTHEETTPVVDPGLASEKLASIWQKIEESHYTELPPITSAGMSGTLNLLKTKYLTTTFTHNGDEFPEGREKVIHKWGTSIKVDWVPYPKHGYSGIFAEGSSNVLLRFSYAKPPQNGKSVPGMGIKVFIDNKPSVNLMAMNGLDEQVGLNIFANSFTNALKAPRWSLQSFLLSHSFAGALKLLRDYQGSPFVLKTEHFASVHSNGSKPEYVRAPYKLVFIPTAAAQALMGDSAEDFRTLLAGHGKGLRLYEIFASDSAEEGDKLNYIGYLIGSSEFVASSYADKELFFQHFSPAVK